MASRRAIAELVLTLDALYGDRFAAPTASQLEVWHQYLAEVSDEALSAALHAWDDDWPPTPVALRRSATAGRTATNAAFREFPFELDSGDYPDPKAALKAVIEQYRARHLRVVGDE